MEERDTYRYDPGDKPKHKQARGAEPYFHEVGGVPIAQCPTGLSPSTVLRLLREGIAYPDEWDEVESEPPKRIYNVYEGVPYVAMRNAPGSCCYHGFPLGYRRLTPRIRAELVARARAEGFEREFKKWCKTHKVD